MKIKVRTLHDGDLILEEIEASPIKGFDDVAVANTTKTYLKGFCAYDVPTGLYICWGRTKKECLEKLESLRLKITESRKTELYQRRLKEFKEFAK